MISISNRSSALWALQASRNGLRIDKRRTAVPKPIRSGWIDVCFLADLINTKIRYLTLKYRFVKLWSCECACKMKSAWYIVYVLLGISPASICSCSWPTAWYSSAITPGLVQRHIMQQKSYWMIDIGTVINVHSFILSFFLFSVLRQLHT
jgi:hypothetical protein